MRYPPAYEPTLQGTLEAARSRHRQDIHEETIRILAARRLRKRLEDDPRPDVSREECGQMLRAEADGLRSKGDGS